MYRVSVYPLGLEPRGVCIETNSRFYIETFSAGKGTLAVGVVNPLGKTEPVRATFHAIYY